MADYSIVGQRPDTEVVGGTNTRPVQVIEVVTGEHNIYFELRIPRAEATTAHIRQTANAFTIIFELLFDIPNVAAVEWTQEPTAAGLLADHVIVYVTSDSGASEGVLDFPYGHFNQDYIAPRVAKLVAGLNATEA